MIDREAAAYWIPAFAGMYVMGFGGIVPYRRTLKNSLSSVAASVSPTAE